MNERLVFSPTCNYPYHKYPFKMFNPVQTKAKRIAGEDCNIVISAATSAGKTVCAELVMDKTLEDDKSIMYLSPLKALTTEKMDDWAKRYSGFKMEIMTGDQTMSERQEADLEEADIILMTSEMLDSRTRNIKSEASAYLKHIRTLIVDEAHIIGTSRGGALECALIRLAEFNPSIRIIFLSATMPNVDSLAGWLTTLNGKETKVIQTDWRPVKLNLNIVPHISAQYSKMRHNKIDIAYKLTKLKPDEKFLIFVHDKNSGKLLQEHFEAEAKMFVPFHNSDLTKKQRNEIEEKFKSKDPDSYRVIVATSTLAWGINMPARNVTICGLHRGSEIVDNADIIQMVGRAGRIGLDTEGFVNVICPQDRVNTIEHEIRNPPAIESNLTDPGTLQFQVLSEIRNKIFVTPSGFSKWFEKTLAYKQGLRLTEVEIQDLFHHLRKIKMIKFDEDEENYEITLTNLGVVSAVMYQDPNVVFSWFCNFNALFRMYAHAGRMPSGKDIPDHVFAFAIGSTIQAKAGFPASDVALYAAKIDTLLRRELFEPLKDKHGIQMKLNNEAAVLGAHMALGNESFFGPFAPNSVTSAKSQLVKDLGRIKTTLQMIDSQYAMWRMPWWKELFLRFATGLSWKVAAFAEMPGVGQARAEKLYNAGFRSVEQVLDDSNFAQASKIMGAGTYKKAKEWQITQKGRKNGD